MRVLEIRSLDQQKKFGADPCSLLYQIARSFPGENVLLDVGHNRIIIIQSSKMAQKILADDEVLFKKNYGTFNFLLGQSRLTSDDPIWQNLQRLSQPRIARIDATKIHARCRHYYGQVVKSCLSAQIGEPFDISPFLDEAAARVLFDLVFDLPLDSLGETVVNDLQTILRTVNRFNWTEENGCLPEDQAAIDAIRQKRQSLGAKITASLSAQPVSGEAEPNLLQSFLTNLINADAVSETISLPFAGYDTTATAIGWALFLLSVQPEIALALREELDSFGTINDENLADFYRLEHLDQFFHECLRIFPPVPMLSRVALREFEVDNVTFAEGHIFVISVIGIHYDKHKYAQPSAVKLERWRDPVGSVSDYLPFGIGKRRCGGALFGEREFKSAVATLIEALDVEPFGHDQIEFDYIGTLRRRGGQSFSVRSRDRRKGKMQ